MREFRWKVFGSVWFGTIAISSLAVGVLTAFWNVGLSAGVSLLIMLLLFSILVAYFSAATGSLLGCAIWAYRASLRSLARRAIASSLSYARTPIGCSGILEIENEVALKVEAGSLDGIKTGVQFNVYESTGDQLWGRVVALEVRDYDCDCIPYDRVNPRFWEQLEDRIEYDTSKPSNVHIIRDVPESEMLESVLELLDNWR